MKVEKWAKNGQKGQNSQPLSPSASLFNVMFLKFILNVFSVSGGYFMKPALKTFELSINFWSEALIEAAIIA